MPPSLPSSHADTHWTQMNPSLAKQLRQWTSYIWKDSLGDKDNPQMASWFPSTSDQAPGQKKCCMDSSNWEDIGRWNINRKDSQNNHWTSQPSWPCYPFYSSLHELALDLQKKSRNKVHGQYQWQVPQRPQNDVGFPKDRKQWNQHEFCCLLKTNPRLLLGLLPAWVGRIQPQRMDLEVAPAQKLALQSFKQSTWTPPRHHLPMDWHSCWPSTSPRQHPFHDRQHNSWRVVKKV